MTSDRRISANRENASKSTGPRTANGKTQSSRNALRHGLAASNARPPMANEKIMRLAAMICDNSAEPIEKELAITIAECQITLAGVRAARVAAIEKMRTADLHAHELDLALRA